ncbi:MAG: HAD family hydrolase [Sandaracinaceae bacterium]
MSFDPLPAAADITALLLDAGNTLVFLEFEAVAEVVRRRGAAVSAATLRNAEASAKRRYQRLLHDGASHEDGWRLYMRTLLQTAGVASDASAVDALREEHDRFNLWRRVPTDLVPALDRAQAAGLRLGVVSNSEGALDALFQRVGLGGRFEVVVDSALEGVRKPDPVIFQRALSRMEVAPNEVIYAGDIPDVDVDGARAAGLHAALIDPAGHFEQHQGARFASVAGLIESLLRG